MSGGAGGHVRGGDLARGLAQLAGDVAAAAAVGLGGRGVEQHRRERVVLGVRGGVHQRLLLLLVEAARPAAAVAAARARCDDLDIVVVVEAIVDAAAVIIRWRCGRRRTRRTQSGVWRLFGVALVHRTGSRAGRCSPKRVGKFNCSDDF